MVVCDIDSDISLIEVAGGKRCLGLGRSSILRLELLLLLRLTDEADEGLRRRPLRMVQLRSDDPGEYDFQLWASLPVRPLSVGVRLRRRTGL